jgi:hypothetical protein
MTSLEDLKPGLRVTSIIPEQSVTMVDVNWHGPTAVELFCKRIDGKPGAQLLFRDDEPKLQYARARIFMVASAPKDPGMDSYKEDM